MRSMERLVDSKKVELAPSFWRTCRSLKNRHRLDLFHDVYSFEGEFGVTEFGRRAGISEPTASNYLRQMNARGILGVRREKKYVYYNLKQDRSLPKAINLQEAFQRFFEQELPKGWQDKVILLLKGYTHFNRLSAIRYLACHESGTVKELEKYMGTCVKGVYHHVRILLKSGIIERVPDTSDRDAPFRLVVPKDPLHKVLHNLSVCR